MKRWQTHLIIETTIDEDIFEEQRAFIRFGDFKSDGLNNLKGQWIETMNNNEVQFVDGCRQASEEIEMAPFEEYDLFLDEIQQFLKDIFWEKSFEEEKSVRDLYLLKRMGERTADISDFCMSINCNFYVVIRQKKNNQEFPRLSIMLACNSIGGLYMSRNPIVKEERDCVTLDALIELSTDNIMVFDNILPSSEITQELFLQYLQAAMQLDNTRDAQLKFIPLVYEDNYLYPLPEEIKDKYEEFELEKSRALFLKAGFPRPSTRGNNEFLKQWCIDNKARVGVAIVDSSNQTGKITFALESFFISEDGILKSSMKPQIMQHVDRYYRVLTYFLIFRRDMQQALPAYVTSKKSSENFFHEIYLDSQSVSDSEEQLNSAIALKILTERQYMFENGILTNEQYILIATMLNTALLLKETFDVQNVPQKILDSLVSMFQSEINQAKKSVEFEMIQ